MRTSHAQSIQNKYYVLMRQLNELPNLHINSIQIRGAVAASSIALDLSIIIVRMRTVLGSRSNNIKKSKHISSIPHQARNFLQS